MKTPQPKQKRQSEEWLRAAMRSPPMTIEAHAALLRQKTVVRRAIEDLHEKRDADLDRWS